MGPHRQTYLAQRLEVVRAAAEVGAHLLVEKPHARSREGADQMIALVEKHEVKSVDYNPLTTAIGPAAAAIRSRRSGSTGGWTTSFISWSAVTCHCPTAPIPRATGR